MKLAVIALFFVGYTQIQSCDDDSDNGNPGRSPTVESTYNYARTKIISSSLSSSGFQMTQSEESCAFSLDIYRGEGTCLTPSSVSGIVNRVNLNGLTRILGPGESLETQGALLAGVSVDFSNLAAELV